MKTIKKALKFFNNFSHKKNNFYKFSIPEKRILDTEFNKKHKQEYLNINKKITKLKRELKMVNEHIEKVNVLLECPIELDNNQNITRETTINEFKKVLRQNIMASNNFGFIFNFLNVIDGFENDEELMLEIVKKNGLMLKYASPKIKYNKNIIYEAIKNNPFAIEHTYLHESESDADKYIVLEAIKGNGNTYKYVSDHFQYDDEIIYYALFNKNPCNMAVIPRVLIYRYKGIDNFKKYLKNKYQ